MSKIDDAVEAIEDLRAKNNFMWMDILRIALVHAPEHTKTVLKQIHAYDREINEFLGVIANDDNS